MSLNMFWFLPTHGDGRYLGTEEGARPVDYGYLQQIAQTADRLGFTGVLIPTGRSCEDAWLVAASMIPVTQRLKFLESLIANSPHDNIHGMQILGLALEFTVL